ncbi:hypothetical protein OS493_027500 [Desmophyllum pertusum]|uniref:Uncharacterized protein n=1 Tax=Desmophyllum pertusum TaxID=174260 RepID=A0A9W9Y9U4_9CNID|nr:hypothetical protein OS493_027500 [Desmophyllum pertusum]
MNLQLVAGIVLLLAYSSVVASKKGNHDQTQQEEETPSEYILPGYVMDDEAAIDLLHRQTEMTYQLNLPKYLEEMKAVSPNIQQQFDDKDFAIVGALATLDATITFGEGIKNLQVIRADTQAGFMGLPNPENGKLHNRVQRLNALRNAVWPLKEKLRSGVVTADSSLMEKLREVQTWLSTQTGGHLGQGMTAALETIGVMDKLKAKWGANSLKFRSFSAAAANGLDFVINGYNTVVNSMAVNQEVTDSNILALSSSIIATSAKVASAAGPIGYAVAATLYIASYATGVSSGLVSQQNLEAKDYVKVFLAPLVPSPDFAAMVEIFDAFAKGNVFHAYYLLMTQTTLGAFYIVALAIQDVKTGSSDARKYVTLATFLKEFHLSKERDKFKDKIKESMKKIIQDIKPKKFLMAYPAANLNDDAKTGEYVDIGWTRSSTLKSDFGITSELTNKVVFFATYSERFSKPLECRADSAKGFTFCPSAVEHGDNTLIFLGSNDLADKVKLDENTEAYGLGGNDHFEMKPNCNKGTVKIDGGAGSDTIDTINSHREGHNYISGGGPERDTIKGGYGKDIISVDNDAVSDLDGDNIFMVEGSGDDDILVGPGADLAIIMKSSGTAKFSMHQWNHKTRDQQKPKRIVYDSDVRLTHGENNAEKDVIKGSYTYHDVLSMTNYKPDTSTQSPDQRIVLLNEGKTVEDYISQISDVVDDLFEDHRGEVTSSAHPGRALMVEDAQHIYFEDIERFELSKHCLNLLLLKNNENVNTRHEVIGGDLDDYVVNLDDDIEVMAQMGTGANRVYSGPKNDAYSLILDDSKDVIYDRGGENIVAIMLQDGLKLEDVQIIREGNDRYRIYKKHGNPLLEYVFHSTSNEQDKVQFLFKDSTGKEVVFKMLPRPQYVGDKFRDLLDIGFYHLSYELLCEYRDIILKISPAKGETLNIDCKRKDHTPKTKSRNLNHMQSIIKIKHMIIMGK